MLATGMAAGAAAAGEGAPWAAPVPVPAPHCVVLPYGEEPGGPDLLRAQLPGVTTAPQRALAPSEGNVHLLVILAEFQDIPHRVPASRFEQILFGSGTTLRDYFATVSGGRLDVTGTVFGWVTLPRTQFAYSQGLGGIGTYPDNAQKMTENAVSAAVLAGLDLSGYDRDGDGVVDALLVVHSGQGYEWSASSSNTPSPDPDAINSHKWVVVDGSVGGSTEVEDYFTCPELQLMRAIQFPAWTDSISTIGVYCHEFGHVLGLPDLYDTATFANRVGRWDIMDFGTWNRDASLASLSAPGALPGRFSAWSRMFLGWADPIVLAPAAGDSLTQSLLLQSVDAGGEPLQLRANPGGVDWTGTSPGSGEYFLAEVRTRTGYDRGLPGEGLLLYHVDESHASNREAEARYPGGGLLVLAPEDDNLLLGTGPGDPWPGSQSTFDGSSRPSSDLYAGGESGVTVAGIGPLSGGTVSLLASVTNLGASPPLPYARPYPWNPGLQGDVRIVLATGSAPGATAVHLFDVMGRHVRTLAGSADLPDGGRAAVWDGTDDAGRRLPAGIYLFRSDGAAAGAGKVLLLR